MIGSAVEARALSYAYPGGIPALSGVTFRVEPGESVAVVGANGAGKSTLLLALNGLVTPSAGQAKIGDLAVTAASLREVHRRAGYVFQDPDDQLFMPTVREDVAFGPLNQGLGPEEIEAQVSESLKTVGAAHLAERAPYRLSGGEKRAVAIAGVIAMRPDVLFLDEPSTGLDSAARRRLIRLLGSLPQTKMIATHDLDLALDACTRVLVMRAGSLEADGAPKTIFSDGALLDRCSLEPPLRWQG